QQSCDPRPDAAADVIDADHRPVELGHALERQQRRAGGGTMGLVAKVNVRGALHREAIGRSEERRADHLMLPPAASRVPGARWMGNDALSNRGIGVRLVRLFRTLMSDEPNL